MLPFGGGGGRVGRSRMRLDEMDCADIMRKAVQRKRSRSIARRESFSGTEDDLRKFREAVQSNDKDTDLQKDIEEYAVKVRELRGGDDGETSKPPTTQPPGQPSDSSGAIQNIKNEEKTSDSVNTVQILKPEEPSEGNDAVKIINPDDRHSDSNDTVQNIKPEELSNCNDAVQIINSVDKLSDSNDVIQDINLEDSNDTTKSTNPEDKSSDCNDAVQNMEPVDNPSDIVEEIQCRDETSVENVEEGSVKEGSKEREIAANAEMETCHVGSDAIDNNIDNAINDPIKDVEEEIQEEKKQAEEDWFEETSNTKHNRELLEVQENLESHEAESKVEDIDVICPQNEESTSADVNPEIENDDVTKECEKRGDDELKETQETDADLNETENDTNKTKDSIVEKMEQIPSEFAEYQEIKKESEKISEEEEDCNAVLEKERTTDLSDDLMADDFHDCDVEMDQVDIEVGRIDLENKESEHEDNETEENNIDVDVSEQCQVEEEAKEENTIVTKSVEDNDSSDPIGFLSIVDRIKNDITTLKTISKEGAKIAANILSEGDTQQAHLPPSESELRQSGLKVALDRVSREKSASHVQIPEELSSHLISLSSANISEQLRKSCSNIVARSQDQELSKEFLLKKLEELLRQERKQVTEDLKRRKEQLLDTKETNAIELDSLKKKHKEELKKLRIDQSQRFTSFENDFLDEMERLKKEIDLLENEKENMVGPNKMISDCLSSRSSSAGSRQLTELESELECCSCSYICRPPCKIYQCPEGDLLCEYCVEEKTRKFCPKCGISLDGALSRNKGLEKIAAKYS